MKPKPLDGKRFAREIYCGRKEWMFFESDVKSACNFYLRYVNAPGLLTGEHPEYKEEVKKIKLLPNPDFFYEEYNEWLFKLAFKDVFEEVK